MNKGKLKTPRIYFVTLNPGTENSIELCPTMDRKEAYSYKRSGNPPVEIASLHGDSYNLAFAVANHKRNEGFNKGK